MKTLFIVRGLPGSGKSTLAKTLVSEPALYHHEADQFFISKNGEYVYDPNLIGKAHQFCYNIVKANMIGEIPKIVVSNTFTRLWEIEPYVELAKEYGYAVEVIRMTGDYGSIHNVPESVIKAMADRFEDFKGEIIK